MPDNGRLLHEEDGGDVEGMGAVREMPDAGCMMPMEGPAIDDFLSVYGSEPLSGMNHASYGILKSSAGLLN